MTNTEKKVAVIDQLERAHDYLSKQSFQEYAAGFKGSMGIGSWYNAIGDARTILGDAALRVANQPLYQPLYAAKSPKTPLEKATTTFDVVDVTDGFKTVATVVVIDGDRFEREVLKGSIKDSDVQKLLPFHTALGVGDNHMHLVNRSAYTAETNSHFIHEGSTLCARAGGPNYIQPVGNVQIHQPTCPGCLIKAKNIIVNHLYATDGIVK